MTYAQRLSTLDRRIDALLSGYADFVDLTDDSPGAVELQQLLNVARLTIRYLDEPLPPEVQERHLEMIRSAALHEAARGRGLEQTG